MLEQLQKPGAELNLKSSVESLAKLWAKKYVQNLGQNLGSKTGESLLERQRFTTAETLRHSLRYTSLQAWQRTEYMIGKEIERHGIDPKLIDPWKISECTFNTYEKTLESYTNMLPPQNLARIIGSTLGNIRNRYTADDPRVIGFVSLQFHFTGQMLLEGIPPRQQNSLLPYFKIIDDHLYMPLQRAYNAAAKHDCDSPTLGIVQKLLPASTEIARNICQRVIQLYPNYFCHSGSLSHPSVKTSSIRDVEMFQVYLWVCILENNIAAIQQELFPLCVMLYPALKVRWELVRQMINLMGKEISIRLGQEQTKLFAPYFQALREMFSPEVFPESLEEELWKQSRGVNW